MNSESINSSDLAGPGEIRVMGESKGLGSKRSRHGMGNRKIGKQQRMCVALTSDDYTMNAEAIVVS